MATLRKRLDNAGVDLRNPKINESFVLIGTPLPPLEKTKDNNEFVPLWKQEVRDEKGRRRLHGAFTGGFSAGYFNTVGSKEGWAPSTFKSSRNDRSSKKAMRPEDFMDEEDLAEMQESRKLVDEEAAGAHDTRAPHANDDSFSVALEDMLPPVNQSVGATILKKMGWRQGQGIGPRLTYEQLVRKSEEDGTPLPAVEDAEARKHTYAPRDAKLLQVSRKDDFHGLGYTAVIGLHSSNKQAGISGPRLSTGFGLGALNDAEDDDIDVYDDGLRSGGRHMAFEAGDDEEERRGSRNPVPPGSTESNFQLVGFFKSGAPLLPGFVIVDLPTPAPKRFDSLEVPEGWKPDPNRVWGSTQGEESSNNLGVNSASSHHQWKAGMSADERGAILGEQQLPSAKRSIWDYLSSKDRERLQSHRDGKDALKPMPTRPSPVQVIDVPRIDPAIAKAALMGFQPFKDDPRKQARYIAYLNSQALSQPMGLQPLPGQSIEDFNAELESLAMAAKIFKPMSAAMASRFRTSSGVETTPRQQEGLYQPTDEAYAQNEAKSGSSLTERVEVEETPKEHAAKMGMFGTMTREQVDWMPAKLLCKRFRVPPPKIAAEDSKDEELNPTQPPYPTAGVVPMEVDTPPAGEHIRVVTAESVGTGNGDSKRDMANIGLGEDDSQGRETLTYERPAMDIFKAIFASDEEASDDEVEKKGPSKQSDEETKTQTKPTVPASVSKNQLDPVAAVEAGPIDLATFRPTFVARSNRDTLATESIAEKSQKGSKKKPRAPALLSFMEDDVGLAVMPVAKKRKRDKDPGGKGSKKKRDKESEKTGSEAVTTIVDEEDDEMWVEKLPAAAAQQTSVAAQSIEQNTLISTGKSRPRASDFL